MDKSLWGVCTHAACRLTEQNGDHTGNNWDKSDQICAPLLRTCACGKKLLPSMNIDSQAKIGESVNRRRAGPVRSYVDLCQSKFQGRSY